MLANEHSHSVPSSSVNLTFDDKQSHTAHSYRTPQWNDHNKKGNGYYAHLTTADFQRIFAGAPNEEEVLSNYELYAYPNFCAYARTLSTYNEFITSRAAKIKSDKQFRKKTAYIPGFEYSFGLWSEKSGFHDFVFAEARCIEQLRTQQKPATKQGNLHINPQAMEHLAQQWSTRRKTCPDNTRLVDRLNALEKTRSQKNISSHGFTTELDYQLHKELTESRNTMNQLERRFAYAHHVQVLAPVVYHYASQATHEHCPIVAFQLSDFCHMVTQVLLHGMHVLYDASFAVGKGVSKGFATITSLDHWKDMATGILQLGLLFADAVGQESALDYSMALARVSQDSDAVFKIAQQYCLHTQVQKDAINRCAQETYQKIKFMSWQDLLEHGTEIGTTMILDTLALNTVGGFTRAASGSFVKQLTKATESGAIFTEQYAVEVAGFGKLIVEEGVDVAGKAADVIKKDLVLCADNQSIIQQVRRTVCPAKWSEEIIHKIRNVGDDILDIMERAGGHTLELHVGQTYDELLTRAIDKGGKTVTTFSDKKIALKTIKESLRNQTKEISIWLCDESKNELILEFSHSYTIGNGIFKGKNNPYYDLKYSRIVLEKNSKLELGFKILTAFPIIK
ncbi:MAG TPA: RNase A-like domain-containing protein [Candidatus Babeliales bacterium]|nr:RNase A-like domain-containing protein [Candidatus Babeliales bacterium]